MVSIVIPVYNEEKNIKGLLESVFKVLRDFKIDSELIIVDDNSKDNTVKMAKELLKNFNGRVICRNKDKDLSSSIIEGFRLANGEIIGVMDADLSHPPEMIPKFLQTLNSDGIDFVIGSRYVKGASIHGWPLYRRIISKTACFLARAFTSVDVKDATSGFFFFKKNIIDDVKLDVNGFKICLELLVRGEYNCFKEIPYSFVNRRRGRSKLNLKAMWCYLVQLYKILIIRLTRNKLKRTLE